jgi:hypothetical protein
MAKIAIVAMLLMFLLPIGVRSDSILSGLFSRLKEAEHDGQRVWKLRLMGMVPMFIATQSKVPDVLLDVAIMNRTGAGLSLQWVEYDAESEKWRCLFSVAPCTPLLGGRLGSKDELDLGLAFLIGALDNRVMAGIGFDFGRVVDRSRWFGLLSIGLNFNN